MDLKMTAPLYNAFLQAGGNCMQAAKTRKKNGSPAVFNRFRAATLKVRLKRMYRKASLGAPAQLQPEFGDTPIKQVAPA